MRNRPKRVWSNGKRDGLTLIEVIAGVVLAGTLLVAIINASSMHKRQLKLIDRKVVAAAAIDDFLNQWSRHQFAQADVDRATKASGCLLEDHIGVGS
jgi:type II secretory pathway pseudopilin PulG